MAKSTKRDPLDVSVGNKCRDFRCAAGLSVDHMLVFVDLDRSTLYAGERGDHSPKFKMVAAYEEVYNAYRAGCQVFGLGKLLHDDFVVTVKKAISRRTGL